MASASSRCSCNGLISGSLNVGIDVSSASGSSALALAAASIIYNKNEICIQNKKLLSIFSRYLASSGSRSSTGGFSLLLSHPYIDPFDCFSIRLDRKEHQSFIDKIALLTIPMQSDLNTSST